MVNIHLQTTRVCCLSDLDIYHDAWRALTLGAPMKSPEWLLVWWRHYAGPDDELCVLLFHEPAGALVGLAPLYIETVGKKKIVRLLGSGDASTNHTTWLTATDWQSRVSHAVAQFLLDLKPGWHSIQFHSVDTDDVAINATGIFLAENGCLVRNTPLHNCWEIALPPSWDNYLKMLSKSHRKRCLKLQRQFIESGRVTVHRVTNEAELSKGFEILLLLHAARWSTAAHPLGCFSDQRFRTFHEIVAQELLKRNQLLLVWLEYEGRPIAVEYQFIDQKTVYSYQAGMDPLVTEFPPGNLSIMVSIRFAIEHGYESFDFSRGDQPYKSNWRATPTACNDIYVWQNNLLGRLGHSMLGIRNMAESRRKKAVKWVKAKVPPHIIDAWRQMQYSLTGKRQGPRKVVISK